jgi:multimeric flavodoxin WrbA
LIERICEGVAAEKGTCEVINLSERKIKRCIACNLCKKEPRFLHCIYETQDDVLQICDKLREADFVIYATPVYVFGISALLKTFLERMYGISNVYDLRLTRSGHLFHHIDREVCSKPFVSVITCDSLEYEMPQVAQKYLRHFSTFMDAPQVGSLVRNGGYLSGYGRDAGRLEAFPRLRRIYAAYRQAGRELVRRGHPFEKDDAGSKSRDHPLAVFRRAEKVRLFQARDLAEGARIYGGTRFH